MPPKSTRSEAASSPNRSIPRSSSVSIDTVRHQHAPIHPSSLRESHLPGFSLEEAMSGKSPDRPTSVQHRGENPQESQIEDKAIRPIIPDSAYATSNRSNTGQAWPESHAEPSARTYLLNHHKDWDREGCGRERCNHGTFSPRPGTHRSYGSMSSDISQDGFSGLASVINADSINRSPDALLGEPITDGLLRAGKGAKTSSTKYLARKDEIRKSARYLSYYIPIFNWGKQYKWGYLWRDFIAALTMASFYIPMSLSLATNLGHIPAINGLYSFVFNPLIYAILGTCPQMVVGPEAAGSLLTGEVVRENIRSGNTKHEYTREQAEIAGIVTCMAGAFILIAGIARLGFLDNVLSRPFLRGFISAVGVVIFIDQLIPETGLSQIIAEAGNEISHGSSVQKFVFICKNIGRIHQLTCAVSFGAFAIIMACRSIKRRLQPRFWWVAYFPDRFIVVFLSAIFAWKFGWDQKGLHVLGEVKPEGQIFAVHWPLGLEHMKYLSDAMSTAFTIACLGFFESSVAAKSLNSSRIQNMTLSANRELVALGVANITGGLFMALPAFGGYGRSKVNQQTGGVTPMSSVFLSTMTLCCILFFLKYFYYLPKGVLSAMISVVAYSLVEEAPADLRFFWRINGWTELGLMFTIFIVTIFWSLKWGIAVGIGLSVLRVIRHSTRPRIQILGRVPGTTDKFENAELDPERLEFIEGCLIVKIPEPLTFANTGDLKSRLKRLEEHGTSGAHPSLPRVRKEHNKNVIFDVHGVTSLDGAGTQILHDLVKEYRDRGTRVFFCRVPSRRSDVWRLFLQSGIVDLCGGERHFVKSVEEALRMTELESVTGV